MQERMPILELENHFKLTDMTRVGSFCNSYLFLTIHPAPLLVFNGLCVRL
jgi:hypothetical protein